MINMFTIIGIATIGIICFKILKHIYKMFFGPHDCQWHDDGTYRFGCKYCKGKWTWFGTRKK